MSKHAGTPSARQMEVFLRFLEDNKDFASGHFKTSEWRHVSKDMWAKITRKLNAIEGCIKTATQWQKVWSDRKYLAKKAYALAQRSASSTNKSTADVKLTLMDHRILTIIGTDDGPETVPDRSRSANTIYAPRIVKSPFTSPSVRRSSSPRAIPTPMQMYKPDSPSAAQMDAFLTFLEEHQPLARGVLRTSEWRAVAKELWSQITEELNAMDGCKKTVLQWMRVWTDKKYTAKKSYNLVKTLSTCTNRDGSVRYLKLTPTERRIMKLIGEDSDKNDTAGSADTSSSPQHESSPKRDSSPKGDSSPQHDSSPQRESSSKPETSTGQTFREYSEGPSAAQLDVFLSFLEDHQPLARGLLRTSDWRPVVKELWNKITKELNSMEGCRKTVVQWQRVWTDKKYLAKKNYSLVKDLSTCTTRDGSVKFFKLTPMEERILQIIGDETSEKDPPELASAECSSLMSFPKRESSRKSVSSPKLESSLKRESSSTQNLPEVCVKIEGPTSPESDPLEDDDDDEEEQEDDEEEAEEEQEIPIKIEDRKRKHEEKERKPSPVQKQTTASSSSLAARALMQRKRRRLAIETDARKRMMEERRIGIEAQRVHELRTIRQEIQELSRVVKTGLRELLAETRGKR